MHKLDPRTKLLSVMLFTFLVFFVNKLPVSICLVSFLILFRLISGISFVRIKYFLNISALAVLIILIQALFGPGDEYIIYSAWGGLFRKEGAILGLVIACRLFSLMIIFPVLTQTTSPYDLASGLYALGFSYRIAFIVSAAFNQVPYFFDNTRLIIDAQRLRGFDIFDKSVWKPKNFMGKIKAYTGICLPIVLCAMRKAQCSSVAMDSRAFGVYKTRSWLNRPKMKAKDWLFLFISLLFVALLLYFNLFL